MSQTEPALTHESFKNPPKPVGYVRWFICGLLFVSTTINYMDRQIIGILKPTLDSEFNWNQHDYANIVTAFQFAYAFGYLLAGRWMDVVGIKFGLPVVVALWSIAAAAHGLVHYIDPGAKVSLLITVVPMSVAVFAVARLALGIFEGGNFPASIRAVAEWFPIRERALATGIFNTGTTMGAIFCPLVVPWIADHWSWPMAFYITGVLGLLWIVLWMVSYESPERHAWLSRAEYAYIQSDRPVVSAVTGAEAAGAKVSWLGLLRFRPAWAYIAGMALTSPVWWFYLFWIPDFLKKQFHLEKEQVGFPVSVIYAITIIGSVGGGWLPSLLMARGLSLNMARKISLLIPAVCAVPVAFAPLVPNMWVSVLLLGFAASAHQAWSANLYTIVSDTMPKRSVSSVVGMGGLVAGFAAMVASQVVGIVLDATNNNYFIPLVACCGMYILAIVLIQLLVPRIEPAAAGE